MASLGVEGDCKASPPVSVTARLDCVVDFELTVKRVVGTDTTFFFFFVGDVRTAALGRTVAGDLETAAAFVVPGRFVFFFTVAGRFFFGFDVTCPAAFTKPETFGFLRALPVMKGYPLVP